MQRHSRQLEALRRLAVVQSIETSNAIEGIVAAPARIAALAAEKTAPENRSEQEIAGYRYALSQVHDHAANIPFEPAYVLQLHGYLFRYTGARHAGTFKGLDNRVVQQTPDGAVTDRFVPVAANRTPAAMDELHRSFNRAVEQGDTPRLLLCAAYVLDLLTIHPFTDGNGRMARLLTLLLLYQGSYGVGRYISLERLVFETADDYYDALSASTVGWHENRHDLLPWTRYLLGILVAAYQELGDRVAAMHAPATAKRDAVVAFVTADRPGDFTAAAVHRALPWVSRDHIGAILRELRSDGVVEMVGAGRGARWRRITPVR